MQEKNMTRKLTSPFRYAIGMFGTSIPVNMFKMYAAKFYVDMMGVTAPQYALVIFIYTFIDAIDNPVYGYLSDRTRTKWGRRRPWFLIGAPLLCLFFVAFYNIPAFIKGESLFGYLLLMYVLTGTLDSLVNANYGALFPELFTTDSQRAKTNALRQAFQLVAMMISVALTPLVTKVLGYGLTAIIYAALAIVVMIFCGVGCHENPEAVEAEKPAFFKTLWDLLRNPKFWIFGATNAFYSAALSLVLQAVPFFVKYTLKLDDINATFLQAAVLLVAVGGVAMWAFFVKKYTLMPVWRAALLVLGAAFVPLYFVTGLATALAACCVVGFGIAGGMTTMDLIGARLMDEDQQKSGLRREGIYSSALGFMNRLNGFFVSLAFLLVNSIYGYQNGENPGHNPAAAARFLMVVFPFVAMVFSCIVSRFLHFPKQAQEESPEQPAAPA